MVRSSLSTIPEDAVKGVIAFSPVAFHPSYWQGTRPDAMPLHTPIIDHESLLQCFQLCNLQPDNSDYFVGLDTESHASLPPAYIVTCGFDPLRDDGRALAESMESQGGCKSKEITTTRYHIAFGLSLHSRSLRNSC